MREKTVGVGIVGCGSISRFHLANLREIPEVKLVGFVDLRRQVAQALKEDAGDKVAPDALVAEDIQALLQRPDLDAVLILTPRALHYEQAKAAFEAGKHVLCEKPLTVRTDHAQELVKLAQEKGLVLLVSYNRHYFPAVAWARQRILRGDIGEVKLCAACLAQDWMRSSKGKWRANLLLSGGRMLIDSGSHLLDQVLWMTGLKPIEVFSLLDRLEIEVDTFVAMVARLENGAIVEFIVSGHSPGFRYDVAIWGTEGSVFCADQRARVEKFDGSTESPSEAELPPPSNPDRNFILAILGRESVMSSGEQALLAVALTEAAYKSAEKGEPVRVGV